MSFSQVCFTQIEIVDKSEEPEIVSIPYSGDFMTFDGIYDEAVKSGVVGEKVTLIDVSTISLYLSNEDYKKFNSVDFSLRDNFKNKTFEVVNYHIDIYDILTIRNDTGEYLWKVTGSDDYVFNKFIDVFKDKFIGKTFTPLHSTTEFESLDGTKMQIIGNQKYTISKVFFAKIKFDYGIVLEFNDSFECEIPLDSYDQPRLFNGEIYTTNDNYINISNLYGTVTLIEENEFAIFSENNKSYLNTIRNRKVQIGMTEKQCRWAWGIPSSSMKNIVGYDKVLIYEVLGNSNHLYFKGDVLKLIK